MSVGNAVLLHKAKMPTPKAWAAEIRRLGFDMALDPDFDVETFSGFLPCTYEGLDARAAIGPLEALAGDPALGPVATRSIQLIERTP